MSTTFDLEEFDTHILNLQSQLSFLAQGLDATDHRDPEWLAQDLIRLKGKASMLFDDMRRVRKRMVGEGVAVKAKPSTAHKRKSIEGGHLSDEAAPAAKKRQSIEGSRASNAETTRASTSHAHPSYPTLPTDTDATPDQNQNQGQDAAHNAQDDGYQVQYVNVTAEVNRRLLLSRQRQLAELPGTSQKRKFDAVDEARTAGDGGEGEDQGEQGNGDFLENEFRSPVKKLKTFGHFEQALRPSGTKRGFGGGDENGNGNGDRDRRAEGRDENKRRRF